MQVNFPNSEREAIHKSIHFLHPQDKHTKALLQVDISGQISKKVTKHDLRYSRVLGGVNYVKIQSLTFMHKVTASIGPRFVKIPKSWSSEFYVLLFSLLVQQSHPPSTSIIIMYLRKCENYKQLVVYFIYLESEKKYQVFCF